jgi:pyruvate,water dikinase
MFLKTDSCRLLADPESPAAERYAHYADFLDYNHRALRLLSELELLDRGAGLATLSSIQRRTERLLEEVRGLVSSLRGMAGGRYGELLQVHEAVSGDLAPLLERRRPAIDGPLIIPFSELTPRHTPLAGSKSVCLARIRNEMGLPASNGFAITTAAFDLFLRENGILELIDGMLGELDPDSAESWEACRRIQERIEQAPLPERLARAIDQEYGALARDRGGEVRIAVRSSAVGEDTEASFAGQYASVLDVSPEKIGVAYRTVLASKYSPRAIVYRLRHGLTDAETPMAVAGVMMVQARASGVLYTVDPSHPTSGQSRIDAAVGMGEQVVGGSASPDVFVVDREPIRIVRGPVGSAGGPEPAISKRAVHSLVESGLKMEAHFGAPQDIEWAEDAEGHLVFLQSRPLGMAASSGESPAPDLSGLKLLLAAGKMASPGRASGKAVQARADLSPHETEDCILVSRTAAPDLAPFMGRVRGLITDLGGAASHLASVAREYHVPALMDAREATHLIPDGQEITLLADDGEVYLGLVPELARKLPHRTADDERGSIGKHLRLLLDRISPLNLTDPKAPEFSPSGCRTLHDLIRFAHEKAMAEMFSLSHLADASVVSRKVSVNIPLSLYFIDLGGGLAPGMTSCDEVLPEHIQCRPMNALWRGLTHPGVTWSGAVDVSARNFMALMAGSIGPENATPPEVDSYALISRDYLNLSVKFGYHYSNLDALCSDDPGANTVTLQFSGGAGTGMGKALRIELLAQVLTRLGYSVEVKGDLLHAALKGLDCPAMEELLDQTGRLLGCSRLLDLAIPSQAEVQALTELFFKGEYDFLGRSETRLPGFYASVGDWSRVDFEGEEVIVQDGSNMGGTVSCSLHSVLDTVLGGRYRRFLENRHALHYYPVAVARDSRRRSMRGCVDVRIRGGCVDLAAGLAFGLSNVGNSLVLAVDASAGEVQILELVNNRRHFRERARLDFPLDRWLRLEVTVEGQEVTGALDGRPVLRYSAPRPVDGYVGLWSKGDTTAFFRDLRTEDGGTPLKS